MKIYRRVRTWIMLGFVVLVPVAMSLLFYVAMGDQEVGNNWSIMEIETQVIMVLITIFTVVKASETVAGEFTWGTIKLLLIRPWSRSSILLSKYIATLLFALFFTVVGFLATFLSTVAFFGYSGSASDMMGVSVTDPWSYMLQYYGLQFVSTMVIVTFGFMMSSAFRSSGLAIGLSIFLLLSGNLLSQLLSLTDKAWVKFVMFQNLNLTAYLAGDDPFPHHDTTLGFSLAVLAGYVIVFNIISWTVFRKRDIAA